MEKSAIEKAIRSRAETRFEEEMQKALESIFKNDILKNLEIRVHSEKGTSEFLKLCDNYIGESGVLMNPNQNTRESKEERSYTNIQKVKNSIIEKYEKEETKKLLERVDSIRYLFEEI